MGVPVSKPASQIRGLLDTSIVATQLGQLLDQSQASPSDELRNLSGYKTNTRKWLLTPGNRFYTGFQIYYELHYLLHQHATMRAHHHIYYFIARRQVFRFSAGHPKDATNPLTLFPGSNFQAKVGNMKSSGQSRVNHWPQQKRCRQAATSTCLSVCRAVASF